MSYFKGLKLTKLGETLLANINGNLNETLTFTSGEIGAGTINSDDEIRFLTSLKEKWKDLDIISIEKDPNDETIIKLELQFSNVDLQEAKLFREIGIYAKGNNSEPVLFAYSNAGENYDYIPLPQDNPQNFTIEINLKITSNSKIDAIINMAGFVTIGKMVEFLKSKLTQIPTVIELQSRKNLKIGDIVEVLGYYTAGDGAGHKRIIANEDDGSGIQLSNKLWANIVHNGEVNIKWLGAKGDGVTNDSDYFIKIFKYNPTKIKAEGNFFIGRTIICREINNINFNFKGEIICPSSDNIFYTFNFINCKNININGLAVKSVRDKTPIPPNGHTRPSDSFSSNVRAISLETCSDVNISNISFENVEMDFTIRGTSELQKCNNINILNWKSRNSSTNMFSDYTDNITIDRIDSILAEKLCSGDHNLYFGTHCKNINIYNAKFRYIDGTYGTTFQCTNGDSDILVPAKNIIIKNADIIAKNTIALGTIDADIHIYDSILMINGNDRSNQTVGYAYDSTVIEFINCNIKSNSEFIVNSDLYKEKEINNIVSFFNCNIQTPYYIFYPKRKAKEIHILNCNIKSSVPFAGVYDNNIETQYQEIINCNIEVETSLTIRGDVNISLIGNIIKYTKPINFLINNGTANSPNAKIINNIFTASTDKFFNYTQEFQIFNNGNIINGKYYNLIKTTDTEITQLNTIYMLEKMKQENVYDDYITYMDEKTTYDKQQREKVKQNHLAYQEALKENPNLTYEEFLSVQPMTLNLLSEPQPSKALQDFMKKYL